MKKILITAVVIFSCMAVMNAQKNELFLKKEFVFKGDTLKYRVLFPENYDRTRQYPLVVFLHGSGERGNDNEKQLVHGASLFTDSENRTYIPPLLFSRSVLRKTSG